MTEFDPESNPPCLEGLIAGTVALLTHWASPSANNPDADSYRTGTARKIILNLHCLKGHPHASPGLKQVMERAYERWVLIAECAADASVVTRIDERLCTEHGNLLLH
jgi:hypothetical protein